jgi:hypothetical protein
MSRRSARTSIATVVWGLALAGGILAHRAGMLPSWVYQGRLRDEVKRRTGVDLADRSTPKPPIEVSNLHGSGGRHPTLTFDVRNATDSTLRYLEMWARFNLATRYVGTAEVARVAGGDRGPLRPGETRTVTLSVAQPQGLGLTTRGPLLTADLYWAFNRVEPHRRGKHTPRMVMVPVR